MLNKFLENIKGNFAGRLRYCRGMANWSCFESVFKNCLKQSQNLLFIFSIDINECTMRSGLCTCASRKENPLCKSTCINTDGNYRCECSNGYYLLNKGICVGKSCEHNIFCFPYKDSLIKYQQVLTKNTSLCFQLSKIIKKDNGILGVN